ncbi:MAG: hypothetical protein NWP98_02485 [Erythrobacter sp.]|nr:hypothetical protein [Erythrobacter sp.]
MMFPATGWAQESNDPPTRAEMQAQDAKAMADSEARVKAWFADTAIQQLKAAADGGDARSQVDFADRIRTDIVSEIFGRDNIRRTMMRYYAMAIEKDYGPAFARIGRLSMAFEQAFQIDGIPRDLNTAMEYFEKGAILRDRDAIAGYVSLALNTKYCSICVVGQKDLEFYRLGDARRQAPGNKNSDAFYRDEKRATMAKAVKYASAARLDAGDAASHMIARALMLGIQVPSEAFENIYVEGKVILGVRPRDESPQWLLESNRPEAERILIELSSRGDIKASRDLADLYLTGKYLRKDTDKYRYFMKQAINRGSILSAYDLGYQLLTGEKIPADPVMGMEFMSKAALAEFGPAQLLAGIAFRDGTGVEKNLNAALQLFELSSKNGQIMGAEEAAKLYDAGFGNDNPSMRKAAATALRIRAKSMRDLSPEMAELTRRAHWEKFK